MNALWQCEPARGLFVMLYKHRLHIYKASPQYEFWCDVWGRCFVEKCPWSSMGKPAEVSLQKVQCSPLWQGWMQRCHSHCPTEDRTKVSLVLLLARLPCFQCPQRFSQAMQNLLLIWYANAYFHFQYSPLKKQQTKIEILDEKSNTKLSFSTPI